MTCHVVHFVNQFFAGLGAEEKAGMAPALVKEGPVGPGVQLESLWNGQARIVATVTCGDTYANEQSEAAARQIVELVRRFKPHLFVAGPAFNSGRYGLACGALAQQVQSELRIPVITGMSPDNPAAELYRGDVLTVVTAETARGMAPALGAMARIAGKLLADQPLSYANDEGYFPRGERRNLFHEQSGARRAVEMMVAKLNGQPFHSEVELKALSSITPAAPVPDLSRAVVALMTEAALVPMGNPDRLESARATRWAKYDISGLQRFSPEEYEPVHTGYDPRPIREDPNRMVPLDALRDLEREGVFGKLHHFYYCASGANSTIETASKWGRDMAAQMKAEGVTAAILTST